MTDTFDIIAAPQAVRLDDERPCKHCGSIFIPKHETARHRGEGLFCSRSCLAKWRESLPRKRFDLIPLTINKSTTIVFLSRGKYSLIDSIDWDLVKAYNWTYLLHRDGRQYAFRRGRDRHIVYLHREVTGRVAGMVTDHRNSNGLDNRRNNLRTCTTSQNNANRRPIGKFKGVKQSNSGRWIAVIKRNGVNKHIGTFDSAAEAAKAYDVHALRIFGEFAWLNFPENREANVA